RQIGREQITRSIRKRLEELPEMALRVRDLSEPGSFPRCGYPVALAIHRPGGDKEVLALAQELAARLSKSKTLTDVAADPESIPCSQVSLEIDRTTVKKLGVPMEDVFNTLQVDLGSVSVSDFNRFGRTWQVNVQVGGSRILAEEIKQLKVRNARGQMVPL